MTMSPKTVVITGASGGIGAAAARELSRRGHDVVVVGRSRQKTADVANEIRAPYFLVDFAEFDSVRALADQLTAQVPRIDVLANNAGGIFGRPRTETVDGHERTFQVNYLSPFLLTGLLIDRLVASGGSVISTASVANRFGRLELDDLEQSAGEFDPRRAYGTAKLAQILFTRELARRFAGRISAAAFHPGIIASGFASTRGSALGWLYNNPLAHRIMRTPEQGADTLEWLVDHLPGDGCPSGAYFARRKPARPNRQAADQPLAEALWQRSIASLQLRGTTMDVTA